VGFSFSNTDTDYDNNTRTMIVNGTNEELTSYLKSLVLIS